MGFFKKDDKKLEGQQAEVKSVTKMTSEQAVSIIREMSGGVNESDFGSKGIVDNFIAVTGASGGAGASTIVSNLAYMLMRKGLSVLVIDLNIMYPIQYAYMGIHQKLEAKDLVSFLYGKSSLGGSINTSKKINLMYANNRTLMDSINCEGDTEVANFQAALRRLTSLYDIVIADCPMMIEHTLINVAFYMCDHLYMVWDEGRGSIANADKIRRNMALSGIDIYTKMSAVMNQRTKIRYSNFPFERLNIRLVETFPFVVDIRESSLSDQIFCEKHASSDSNANSFYNRMERFAGIVLDNAGYIKERTVR